MVNKMDYDESFTDYLKVAEKKKLIKIVNKYNKENDTNYSCDRYALMLIKEFIKSNPILYFFRIICRKREYETLPFNNKS